jgi:hypothetical protein
LTAIKLLCIKFLLFNKPSGCLPARRAWAPSIASENESLVGVWQKMAPLPFTLLRLVKYSRQYYSFMEAGCEADYMLSRSFWPARGMGATHHPTNST